MSIRGALAVGCTLSASWWASAAQAFDLQSLQTLIQRDHLTTIESVLAELPDAYRSHYVLVFDSRSLQQATLRDPRVILFGNDARFLLSFNGDPSERGYRALEVAQYDLKSHQFHFRELEFPEDANRAAGVNIPDTDTATCKGCHGTPARPVWDSSPLWPGVYGERYRSNLSAAERSGIEQFLQRQPTHPRYRYLIGASRFGYRTTYLPDARTEYNGEAAEPPNAEFSQLLSALNLQMIAAELSERSQFPRYRYALLGVVEHCGAAQDFWPDSQHGLIQGELRRLQQATERINGQQDASKRARALSDISARFSIDEADGENRTMTGIRLIAQSGLGVSDPHWTLALERNSFDFTTPQEGDRTLVLALRDAVVRSDTELTGLAQWRDPSTDDRYCSTLRARSRAALEQAPPPVARADESSSPTALLQHCALCHTDGPGPRLPFAQPESLGARLSDTGYAHGTLGDEIAYRLTPEAGSHRMPPDFLPSPEQRDAFVSMLQRLSKR